jgi:hypothetical protein
MRKIIFFLFIVLLLISPVLAGGYPVRQLAILYPKGELNITQGNLVDIPVSINNTGNMTLANIDINFETPEGWHSNSNLIKFIHPGIVKDVTLNMRPPYDAYGYYNVTLHVVSLLANIHLQEKLRVFVHGEKPPEYVVEENLRDQADEKISKARESLQKALDMDLNITGVSNVFTQAIDNYNSKNYTQAIFLAELSYNASEKLIAEKPNETTPQTQEGEGIQFDYTIVLLLLVFVLILISINKFFL